MLSVVSTLSVVATGCEVKSTVPFGSVTVYETSACCCFVDGVQDLGLDVDQAAGVGEGRVGRDRDDLHEGGAGRHRAGDRLGDLRC